MQSFQRNSVRTIALQIYSLNVNLPVKEKQADRRKLETINF